MEPLLWLDIPLVVFGVLAILSGSWNWLRRRYAGWPRSRGVRCNGVMVLAFSLGVASITAAGMDIGFAESDKARGRANQALRSDGYDWFNPMRPFPVGTPAPDFQLSSLTDGASIRLSDFHGLKPVVLVLSSFT